MGDLNVIRNVSLCFLGFLGENVSAVPHDIVSPHSISILESRVLLASLTQTAYNAHAFEFNPPFTNQKCLVNTIILQLRKVHSWLYLRVISEFAQTVSTVKPNVTMLCS